MKKVIAIGIPLALLIVVLLLWLHPHRSILTGTWAADIGHGTLNTTTVRPDGGYTCLITNGSNGQVQTWEGRMDVKDGLLINTITNVTVGTQTVAGFKKGVVTRAKIIQMDDHTLVIQPPDLSNSVTFIKK